MRIAAVFACLLVSTSSLFASAQRPERLIYEDKEFPLRTTPLESYLDKLPEVVIPFDAENWSTGLWRRYVATWTIKDDKLWLLKIEQPRSVKKADGRREETWHELPIETVFPKQKSPVSCDWYTGVLRASTRKEDSKYSELLLLVVEKGAITKRIAVSSAELDRFRSFEDHIWIALGDPPKGAEEWTDARLLATPAVDEMVRSGKPIKVRGEIATTDGKQPVLYLSQTQETEHVIVWLEEIPKDINLKPGARVEVAGVVTREPRLTLKVKSSRNLVWGESMYSSRFEAIKIFEGDSEKERSRRVDYYP